MTQPCQATKRRTAPPRYGSDAWQVLAYASLFPGSLITSAIAVQLGTKTTNVCAAVHGLRNAGLVWHAWGGPVIASPEGREIYERTARDRGEP